MSQEELTEDQLDELIAENNVLLVEFEKWLIESGLKQTTIDTHTSNVEFFINDYLTYYENIRPEDGIADVPFFMSWFIRKASWSSRGTLKSNGTSFKKFYTFLLEKGLVEITELIKLTQTIKLGMPQWIEELEQFEKSYIDYY
ncbi:hypothetical protein JQC92_04730 [Shewanella sp. 202IG2-18]|uniref:hypothetical protein n=1 Tax=Parashewanella hymeniacidonis TaxID=2807618 RepID=UPI0019602ECA|nr:hypothetical protein [Parashewanella hymeniacidonis]MBM7071348.1 hypothetical protein [Parashewanella hymeniacidonis]